MWKISKLVEELEVVSDSKQKTITQHESGTVEIDQASSFFGSSQGEKNQQAQIDISYSAYKTSFNNKLSITLRDINFLGKLKTLPETLDMSQVLRGRRRISDCK